MTKLPTLSSVDNLMSAELMKKMSQEHEESTGAVAFPTPDPTPFDGVFEGGGVKGIGHVGAYAVLHERGFLPKNVAGTSAGAIVATLIAAGYDDPKKLRGIFEKAPLPTFPHSTWWEQHLGLPANLVTLAADDGIYDTSALRAWLTDLLEENNIRTFANLIADDSQPKSSIYRYKVQVVASDITKGRKLVLPRDIADYGQDPDTLSVVDAVIMSASIPFYFRPFKLNYEVAGVEYTSLIVDGGLLSNFPVDVFDVPAGSTPEWPTFGFKLVEPQLERPHDTSNIISFTSAVVTTALEGNDAWYLDEHKFVRTIPIPCLGIQGTDWTLSDIQRDALYQSGRTAANEFLTRWNFTAYKKLFRGSTEFPQRTERVRRMLKAALP